MLAGITFSGVCQELNIDKLPSELELYLICSPAMDGNLRFLPKAGGYYDQDYIDMKIFRIIESRIFDFRNREAEKVKRKK